MLGVVIAACFVAIIELTILIVRVLSRGWTSVVLSLAIVTLPPIGISPLAFPSGSGAGWGMVILLPLLWIVGFTGVTAGNLLDGL